MVKEYAEAASKYNDFYQRNARSIFIINQNIEAIVDKKIWDKLQKCWLLETKVYEKLQDPWNTVYMIKSMEQPVMPTDAEMKELAKQESITPLPDGKGEGYVHMGKNMSDKGSAGNVAIPGQFLPGQMVMLPKMDGMETGDRLVLMEGTKPGTSNMPREMKQPLVKDEKPSLGKEQAEEAAIRKAKREKAETEKKEKMLDVFNKSIDDYEDDLADIENSDNFDEDVDELVDESVKKYKKIVTGVDKDYLKNNKKDEYFQKVHKKLEAFKGKA